MDSAREIAIRRPTRWRLLACACTVGVLVLCYLPGDATPHPPIVNLDKVLHGLAFCAVAFAWRRAGLTVLQTLALGFGLAAVTEGGQALMQSGRSGDVGDFAADLGGVALGLLLARHGGKR